MDRSVTSEYPIYVIYIHNFQEIHLPDTQLPLIALAWGFFNLSHPSVSPVFHSWQEPGTLAQETEGLFVGRQTNTVKTLSFLSKPPVCV